jgi:hypothetical protein
VQQFSGGASPLQMVMDLALLPQRRELWQPNVIAMGRLEKIELRHLARGGGVVDAWDCVRPGTVERGEFPPTFVFMK